MRFLDDNRGVFRQRLAEESPEWVPEWVDERVFARLFTGLQSFLADVSIDDGARAAPAASTGSCVTTPRRCAPIRRRPRGSSARRSSCWTTRRCGSGCRTLWAYAEEAWCSTARRTRTPTCGARSTSLTVRAGEVLRDDPAAAG